MLIIQVESIACRDLFGVKAAAGLLFGTAQDCCVRRHLGIYVGPYSLLSGVVGQFVPSMRVIHAVDNYYLVGAPS